MGNRVQAALNPPYILALCHQIDLDPHLRRHLVAEAGADAEVEAVQRDAADGVGFVAGDQPE